MQQSSKMWIVVAVVLVVFIGGYWWRYKQNVSAPYGNAPTNLNRAAVTPTPAVASSDSSDAALNQDLSAWDNQMDGLSSDSAEVDQSLNNQPILQGQ